MSREGDTVSKERERREAPTSITEERERRKKVISFHPFIRIRGKMQVERMNE